MKTPTLTLLLAAALALGHLPGCAGEADRPDDRPDDRPGERSAQPAKPPADLQVGDTFTIPSGQRGVPGITVDVAAVGAGPRCGKGRRASVHYILTLADGSEIESSRKSGTPFPFVVGSPGAIEGWQLIAEQMRVGDRWNVVVPYQLAYGERGGQGMAPRTNLHFDMELMGIR